MSRHLIRLLVLSALGLTACADRAAPLRIGAKSFAEQALLAEMVAALARRAGVEVAPIDTCGDTYACHRKLRDGEIDVMVEYTGTGLRFIGAVPGQDSLDDLQQLYAPLGLRWLKPIGFDNGYRVLVRADRPQRTIGDLAGVEGLRVVAPPEYVRRPGDGLGALVTRYGLRLGAKPLLIEPPSERYQALVDGRADAAIGYATDGAIAEMGLKVLADPAGFFPPYEGAVLVREDAADRHPGLVEALGALEGRIDTATMRDLNARVQLEGRDAGVVARGFLATHDLVDPAPPGTDRPPVRIAVHPGDGLEAFVPRARRAVRAAFPDRPVSVVDDDAPIDRVAIGAARLTVIGAERFFRKSLRSLEKRTVRDDRVEAVAALGTRMLHLVRRADDAAEPFAGRVGVPPEDTGPGFVGSLVLRQRGEKPARRADAAALLSAVRAGDLDAALVLAKAGDPGLTKSLAAGGLALRPVQGWLTAERALVVPFLRPARVPPGTYAGQDAAVETLGAQVVLADAAPAPAIARGGGPAAALPSGGIPLTADQVDAVAKAAGVAEAPDPVLPSAWGARVATPAAAHSGAMRALHAVLNVLVVVFTVWLVLITLRPDEDEVAS